MAMLAQGGAVVAALEVLVGRVTTVEDKGA